MNKPTLVRVRNRRDAARYIAEKFAIPCSESKLAKLAVVGGGPAFRIVAGRFAVYDEPELDAWAIAQFSGLVNSTAEAGTKLNERHHRALIDGQRRRAGGRSSAHLAVASDDGAR
jgi:hypothetical protein